MDIRKRSPGNPNGDSLDIDSSLDHNPAARGRSPIVGRRKRGRSSRQQFPTAIMFLLCSLPFIIYSVSVLIYLTPPPESTKDLYTIDRVLHHKVPELSVVRSRGRVGLEYIPIRPRMLGYYFESATSSSFLGTERMDANVYFIRRTFKTNGNSPDLWEVQETYKASEDYGETVVFETGDCAAQYDWQKKSYPTCNLVMEQDLTDLRLNANGNKSATLLAHGYWRDVWGLLTASEEQAVLKTMRYEHEFEPRNYDRHRRDAVAMEQFTGSQWIMNIYSFCGNSGVFEFADGGDLDDSIFSDDADEWSMQERLVVAYQVASGIAEVHNYHKEGVAAIAHTDITTSQFVYVSSAGVFKLNDFNRCRFIRWNKKKNKACTFKVGNNPGDFRSPEEYKYSGETEMVDVYSMGNIFYTMLMGVWPFEIEDVDSKKKRKLVKEGLRPTINQTLLESSDPYVKTLVNATKAAWVQDPRERAPARAIQKYLESRLISLGVPNN